ncbi:MAG: hypothetical protein ABI273_11555 [Lacunisphaera sp.]
MKSFLQGKRALDIAPLKAPQTGAVPAIDGTKSGDTPEVSGMSPQVELVKQGDKIVRIIVTCTCGERTEIDCLYPPGQ